MPDKDLIRHCRQIVISHVSDCADFFNDMDALLLQISADADTDAQRKSYLIAKRQLRSHEQKLNAEFSQSILDGFDKYWMNTPATKPSLEFHRREVVDEFTALHYRFSHLLGHSILPEQQPLSLPILKHCFKQALARFVNIDPAIKKLAHMQFNRTLGGYADHLYYDLNQYLASQKILSNLKYKSADPQDKSAPIQAAIIEKQLPTQDSTPEALVEQIAVGSRFLRTDINPHKKIRFSWQSRLTGRYVFNNRHGEPALDLSKAELLNLLKQKQLTPIAEANKIS